MGCETTHATREEHPAPVSLFIFFFFFHLFLHTNGVPLLTPLQCQLYSPEIYLACTAVLLSVDNAGRAKCGTGD